MCIPCFLIPLEDLASQRRCRQSVTLEQYSVQLHIFEPTKTRFLQYSWSLMNSQEECDIARSHPKSGLKGAPPLFVCKVYYPCQQRIG